MTLTQALLLAAGLVVAGLLAQGWWTARRARSAVAPERQEPALAEAVAAAATPSPDEVQALRVAPRKLPRLDPLIDALAAIVPESPVAGEAVLPHLPATNRVGGKPFYVEGLDAETGEWVTPMPGRRYTELQAGVQMTHRGGPLSAIEFSEFVQKVQAFAEALGLEPELPDMQETVARARELDQITAQLDVQLQLTLRSNGVAWSVGYVQQCAARHGFVPGALPGRLVVPGPDEGAPPVLVLTLPSQVALAALGDDPSAAAVREFTLSLDVPQTPREAEPFPAWHRAATALSEDMDASVVDEQGQTVVLAAYAGIAQQLEQLYARLEALDLPAGSAAARRLFS